MVKGRAETPDWDLKFLLYIHMCMFTSACMHASACVCVCACACHLVYGAVTVQILAADYELSLEI